MLELAGDDEQLEWGKYTHSVALTVIKDIITRWNSTYYMLERCITLEPFIKDVCREFNIQPAPTALQWESASKLCKLLKPLREMSVFF